MAFWKKQKKRGTTPVVAGGGAKRSGYGIKGFRFHGLRRTFNTNMQRAGVRNTVTMELTGHKTLATFTRYSSVVPADAQEAVAKFPSFLEKEGETTLHSASNKKKGLGTECLTP